MKMVQESRNHKEQINQSIIKLSSSLQRALNTESLTSMQINNRKQSGKKGSKCRHLGLFFLHLCRLWRRHILEGELFTHWGSATWKCCVGVCVYICVEGIFRMEKKKCNFSGQQTEFPWQLIKYFLCKSHYPCFSCLLIKTRNYALHFRRFPFVGLHPYPLL